MKFFAAKCPQCSGELQLPWDKEIVTCMYCKSEIVVERAKEQSGPNIAALIELAEHAKGAGNYLEAEAYFGKTLELNPSNFEAWIGKGESAAWQSTLANYRGEELISAFEKALDILRRDDESKLESTKKTLAVKILAFAQAFHSTSVEHTIEFMGVASSRYEHWNRCRNILRLCDKALEYDLDLRQVNEFAVDVCSRSLNVSGMNAEDKQYFQAKKAQFDSRGYSEPASGQTSANGSSEELSTFSVWLRIAIGVFVGYAVGGAALRTASGVLSIILWIITGLCVLYVAFMSWYLKAR